MNDYIKKKRYYYFSKDFKDKYSNLWIILVEHTQNRGLSNFISIKSGLTSYLEQTRLYNTEVEAAKATIEQSQKSGLINLAPFPLKRILEIL